MIVGVLNTKGGVGKTTLAINLAIARAMAGRDVWLIDGDRQETAMQAITQRAERGRVPAISISGYTDGSLMRTQIKQQGSKFDDIIIDAGGRDSGPMRAAMMLANVVLAPFQPRSFDVWAMSDLAELANNAYAERDDLKVYAVLNQADPLGHDNAEAASVVAGINGVEYLDAPIGRRKAIADAAGSGLSVLEFSPADAKARVEMRRLVELVFGDE